MVSSPLLISSGSSRSSRSFPFQVICSATIHRGREDATLSIFLCFTDLEYKMMSSSSIHFSLVDKSFSCSFIYILWVLKTEFKAFTPDYTSPPPWDSLTTALGLGPHLWSSCLAESVCLCVCACTHAHVCHVSFAHLSVGEHLGWSHSLVILNSITVDMSIQVSCMLILGVEKLN